ncbi:MAG: GxxExxY protein [Candidatus Berkelbacteria bacterium]|nr:GxxExxY protein [Candidatus Berkelbacteria bacterium]
MDNQQKVIYPELSYKIVGCLFEVYKNLGSNHKEKLYQQALKQEFADNKINFKEQVINKIIYKGRVIGTQYFDFIIEDKIILEIKAGRFFKKDHFEQILDYLKSTNLRLGIIANFKKDGVQFYRVLNQ